jgi:phage major head subunit gpT-like protein
MSAKGLSSRAIVGEYYATLEAAAGMEWINAISNLFSSNQESETYKWLGQTPAMQEWIGGRQAKGFRENGITISNLHFEATLEVMVEEMRRDKTGQVMIRIAELADRTNSHWASLLSTLVLNAESTVCYDGQFFFDTDHSEGDSGTQSNDIAVDISTLPVGTHGSVTVPSVGEMQLVILQAIQQIYGFLDDQGEPLNETARNFMVMVPTSLWHVTSAAAVNSFIDQGDVNTLANMQGINVGVVANPRLTWTDKVSVWRTDGRVRPLIRQQETEVDLKVIAEGSELEFTSALHQYGVDAWRNVGYGLWQGACLATMI